MSGKKPGKIWTVAVAGFAASAQDVEVQVSSHACCSYQGAWGEVCMVVDMGDTNGPGWAICSHLRFIPPKKPYEVATMKVTVYLST